MAGGLPHVQRIPKAREWVSSYTGDSLIKTYQKRMSVKESLPGCQVCVKYNFAVIDVNDGLTDDHENLRKELTLDGAHMLPVGYEIVLGNMTQYLL